MSFKVIADTFSITRDSDHFIQVKTLKVPPSEDQVFLVMEIEGETKYARATSQKILEILEDIYFDGSDTPAYERFENALKEVNLLVSTLKEKKGGKGFGGVSALAGVLSGNELHLTQAGSAEAYLLRKNKFTMISEGLSGKAEDLFTNIATGDVLPDDKLIFSTTRLLRLATYSQLAQVFSDGVTESLDTIREMTQLSEDLNLGVFCAHLKLPHTPTTAMEKVESNLLLQKVTHWFQSKFSRVTDRVLTKTGGRPEMSQKTILAALAVTLVLLFMSVSFLMDASNNRQKRNEYRQRIEALNQELHTANTKGYANDKETANAILTKVEGEARDILEANYFRPEVLALLEKTQEIRDSINNTTRVKDLKPYVDLSVKKPDILALGLTSLDSNLYAFEFGTLFQVVLDQVLEPKVIDSKEVVIKATAITDQSTIAFLTQSGRIIDFQDGQFKSATTEDAAWKSAVDIASYGRNIYLLSPANNQIYKYSRLRANYSTASDYNLDADLANAISMTVDGNVYVLKKGGEIVKLFKGNKQNFKINALGIDISEANKIFTTTDLNQIYILDSANKRIVIADKDRGNGEASYKGQITFEDLPMVKDFYVEENKVYLLTEKAIYKVDI
jgi:hypothetical protein